LNHTFRRCIWYLVAVRARVQGGDLVVREPALRSVGVGDVGGTCKSRNMLNQLKS
jgi:hypothetical protein